MHNPTEYLKLRVLGAIDAAPGNSIRERIRAVSNMSFVDEDGLPRSFSWRTIETWRCRYHKHGLTALHNQPRCDKGRTRKIMPERIQEAIDAVLPKIHVRPVNCGILYRLCIESGLLLREQIAPNTFRRVVKRFELLKPANESENKHRLAFANEMWQADTLIGPYVQHNGCCRVSRTMATTFHLFGTGD